MDVGDVQEALSSLVEKAGLLQRLLARLPADALEDHHREEFATICVSSELLQDSCSLLVGELEGLVPDEAPEAHSTPNEADSTTAKAASVAEATESAGADEASASPVADAEKSAESSSDSTNASAEAKTDSSGGIDTPAEASKAATEKENKSTDVAEDSEAKKTAIPSSDGWGRRVEGSWSLQENSAGGCLNHATWRQNQQLMLRPSGGVETAPPTLVRVEQKNGSTTHGIGFYVLKSNGGQLVTVTEVIAKSAFRKSPTVTATVELPPSAEPFVLIPTTYQPGEEADFIVYCDEGLEMRKLTDEERLHSVVVTSHWEGESAGGCRNHGTWPNNPQFFLSSGAEVTLHLTQSEKSEFEALGMYAFAAPPGGAKVVGAAEVLGKASFSSSKESSLVLNTDGKTAVILPCTFNPGNEAKFSLTAYSKAPVELREISEAGKASATGEWSVEKGTAGGPPKYSSWRSNPQFLVTVSPSSTDSEAAVSLRLQQKPLEGQEEKEEKNAIGLYVFPDKGGKRRMRARPADLVTSTAFRRDTSVTCDLTPEQLSAIPGYKEGGPFTFSVMPCTYEAGDECAFELSVFSTNSSSEISAIPALPYQELSYRVEGESAGGCLNFTATWRDNKQLSVTSATNTRAFILLEASGTPEPQRIGMYVAKAPKSGPYQLAIREDTLVRKAPFRTAKETYCVVSLKAGQTYNVMPCTYNPGIDIDFKCTIFAEAGEDIQLSLIPAPTRVYRAFAAWFAPHAGGCMSNLTWWLNPRFLLDAPDAQTVTVVLRQCNPSNGNLLPIGFYITKSDEDGRPFIEEEADIIGRSPFEPALDISVTLEIEAHERPLMIVPCTFHPDMEGDFELVVYCEKENTGMEMLPLPEPDEIGEEVQEEDEAEEEAEEELASEKEVQVEPEVTASVEKDLTPAPAPEPAVAADPPQQAPVPEPVTEPTVEAAPAVAAPPPKASDGPPPMPAVPLHQQVAEASAKKSSSPASAGVTRTIEESGSGLLDMIKRGKALRKVEVQPRNRKRTPTLLQGLSPALDRIIARRTAMEPSDDEESDSEFDDDDW